MLNQCNFIGNLGKDPEIRALSNGNEVANISLGVSKRWKDKDTGEQKEKTEWVRITVFGSKVNAVKYLKKGSKVYVSGELQTRKWQDESGQDRYSTEVVIQGYGGDIIFLDKKPDQNEPVNQPVDDTGDIPF